MQGGAVTVGGMSTRTDALADPLASSFALLLTVPLLELYAVLWRVGVVEVRGRTGGRVAGKRIGLGWLRVRLARFVPTRQHTVQHGDGDGRSSRGCCRLRPAEWVEGVQPSNWLTTGMLIKVASAASEPSAVSTTSQACESTKV
ncbi:hypothetical protein ROJ27_00454 [Mycobacterium tuberculosis variant bovis]